MHRMHRHSQSPVSGADIPAPTDELLDIDMQSLCTQSAHAIIQQLKTRAIPLWQQVEIVDYLVENMSDIDEAEALVVYGERILTMLDRQHNNTSRFAQLRAAAEEKQKTSLDTQSKSTQKRQSDKENDHFQLTPLGLQHAEPLRLIIHLALGSVCASPDEVAQWQHLFGCAPADYTDPARPLVWRDKSVVRLTFLVKLLTGRLQHKIHATQAKTAQLPAGEYTVLPLIQVAGDTSPNAPIWHIVASRVVRPNGKPYQEKTIMNALNQSQLPPDQALDLLHRLRPLSALLLDGQPLPPTNAN